VYKVEFAHLEIQGFRSIARPIRLELGRYGPGLHFLRGANLAEPGLRSNGAGKSTIWEALTWCLYGKTTGGLRSTDVQSWLPNSGTIVGVGLLVNKRLYEIVRTAAPNSLTIDDKDVGQEAVDKLVGLSYETFRQTVLFGQGQPLFLDLPPRSKMELFSEVLQLERWDRWSEAAGKRAKTLSLENSQLSGEMIGAEARLADLNKMVNNANERAKEWAAERQKAQAQAEAAITQIKRRLQALQTPVHAAQLTYDGVKAEAASRTNLQAEVTRAVQDARVEVERAHARVATLKKQLDQTRTGRCPTCGQSIKGDHKHLEKLKQEVAAGVPKKLLENLKAAEGSWKVAFRDNQAHEKKASGALEVLSTMGIELAELNSKLQVAQKARDEYADSANPYRQQYNELRKLETKAIVALEEITARHHLLQRRVSRAQFWVKGFKDIRLLVIEEVLQDLEFFTNALLLEVGLDGWSIQYSIEKLTKSGTVQTGLNTTILSPTNRSPVRWEVWSGGESQRLRLAGSLALSEVLLARAGVSVDLTVLDEPTRGLSAEGIRDMCSCLAQRAQDTSSQVWLVDHHAVPSSQFASTLTVVKTDSGTEIGREDS